MPGVLPGMSEGNVGLEEPTAKPLEEPDTDEDKRLGKSMDDDSGNEDGEAADGTPAPGTPVSKNQLKKLKRQQKWEGMRDDRKRRRKEKRQTKQAQKRAAREETGVATTATPKEHVLTPVSLIFDCDFEAYMRETELISLSSQITRSYAANRAAARSTRIYVSSWAGKLRTRYETLLASQHKRWNHVYFVEDDYVAAARQADTAMRGGDSVVVDVLRGDDGVDDKAETTDGPSLVYLTSDSPHTLDRLEPYTSYVIGGIVDKNREKGLCYRRAQERGVRTAKLPIGEYMVMASRQVLTTNQVVEIMLSWLETGDWATAFTNVIPKRKGGHLRAEGEEEEGEGEAEADGKAEQVEDSSEADETADTAEKAKQTSNGVDDHSQGDTLDGDAPTA